MLPYAILGLQIRNLLQNFRVFHVFRCFPSNQQHIFRRMFHLDELHHLGLVAEILQNQGADGVGDHHSLTFEEDAVSRDGIDFARTLHLLPDLLVATECADNQLRSSLDARGDGIVGGRVAGMKRNQHIQLFLTLTV